MFSVKISDSSSLKNLLISNACYSFTWQNYLNQNWLEDKNNISQAVKIQEFLDLIDLKRSNLLKIDHFYTSLKSNENLNKLMTNDFVLLPDKVLKSSSSSGNYFFKSIRSNHVVTNIKWLSDLIESIPYLKMDADLNMLKNNVPALAKQTLGNQLSSLVSENMVVL